MTQASAEERFRLAAVAEGGAAVSAGARVAHVRMAVESGRALFVDLSILPEGDRPAVIAAIQEAVERAAMKAANPPSPTSRAAGAQLPPA